MRRHRSYISSREDPRPSSFRLSLLPSPPLPPPYLAHGRTRAQKRRPLREGPKQKRVPTNTACNRVNCAAYAFISLFRDNLLIVSTKRDNPPCRPSGPVFSAVARETPGAVGAAQKGSICMRVNAPPFPSPFLTTLTM